MTMDRPIRVGVLGCGRIGRFHADLLSARIPGLELACLFDPVVAFATEVGARLRVPVVGSADEMLASPDVGAVAVCTSTNTHVDLLVAAAGAGKAILCEKPVSLTLGEVDRALAAVDRAGVTLQIGFNRRYDPGHRSVHDAVARGEVGDVHLVRISSRDPAPPPLEYVAVSGGIFLDMTIHDFDMARYVTGSEVDEVYAQGAVRITPEIADYDDVDTAIVQLRHANGCLTTIDNSRQAVYGFDQRVEAFGSAGVASSDNPLVHAGVVRTEGGGHVAALPHFFVERYTQSFIDEWSAFGAAVRRGGPSEVTGADGRAPLVIGLAAWRSVREHRPVALSEVDVTPRGERQGARR
jgi:myo-inositol 2-dehydrogenase / D-chiro-inositol 1-dehydrogenase